MPQNYQTTTYVRYIGELPTIEFKEDGTPVDVRSDIRFTWKNTQPFTVQYVTYGLSLFGIYTVQVN
jgi:hypothetical protein